MFTKILIANRGEIACRVAATARRMGVRTVAVYSDADASAKHVAACDEAVHIGGSAPKDSYLQWQRILDAAKATGAQAIHPGYGFLSENEAFAKRCEDEGIAFIGPRHFSIAAMGDKIASKKLANEAKVNTIPGYNDAIAGPEQAVEYAPAFTDLHTAGYGGIQGDGAVLPVNGTLHHLVTEVVIAIQIQGVVQVAAPGGCLCTLGLRGGFGGVGGHHRDIATCDGGHLGARFTRQLGVDHLFALDALFPRAGQVVGAHGLGLRRHARRR